ncbi:acetylglutamate/acetylaminoadipate kinase [Halococcoides cellulosivorans]|uniref:Putative [LysW]-aminoadipate/[LysW]-glutamate kinase n=1 Tax=Halococcoides cellulosivorans TaxID=1679096 RepID=A0A2R4WY75_9EURY|nr:acetylglutamate/acetylaminoadipate kinase [Halococcoides cellulosivorans]AWB26486.1 acetylglutamate kinase [Halococcoides cellulosivorans]
MTVVVKVGGARAVDPAGAIADVAALAGDERVVLVHGGSTAVDEALESRGVDPEYVETPDGVVGRFTDAETMGVVEAVFGRIRTDLVADLQTAGVDAIGLSGVDGELISGPRTSAIRIIEDGKRKIKRGDHSGSIETVDPDPLETLLDAGYTPVVGPPMAGQEDDGITPVNVDADRSAAAIAGALDADLVLLTDVEGVYRDPDDPATKIESVATADEWATLEASAEGFMTRKVMAAAEALDAGAPTAIVADANSEAPIRAALDGAGTTVHQEARES